MSSPTSATSRLLADRLELRAQQRSWRGDFRAWCEQRADRFVWSKQVEIAEALKVHKRVAVKSCHGAGKTAYAAMQIGQWVDTHPPKDTMVISTAPSDEQVHSLLWEEIRQLHDEADLPGDVQLSDRWIADDGRRQVGLGRKPANYAKSQFQGWHREHVLVVADEADGIVASMFDDFEFITTGDDCRILAIGNPTDASSYFARICDGTVSGWHVITISAFQTPNLSGEPVPDRLRRLLVSAEWCEDKLTRWGENSPLYKARVLAEFPEDGDNLIPLSWVRAANRRWSEWFERWDGYGAGDPAACARALWRGESSGGPAGRRVISCDVATTGLDQTAIATKQGDVVFGVERWSGAEIPQINGLIAQRLSYPRSHAIVDAVGEGAGVYQTMRHDYPVTAFKGSYSTRLRDSGGVIKYPNVRVFSWYHLRELLNPALGATLALPPDDELAADLVTPKYEPRAGGQVWVESKDEIRKRLGRSTDAGDAVAMGCFHDRVGTPDRSEGATRRAPRAIPYADAPVWT